MLILLSGASGNLITAFIYRTAHTSIGASTALFGAVGMLGASRCALGRRYRLQGRKTWFYIAGTVTLVAVMGVGENVDVFAHLFGAVMGVILGFPSARKMSRPSGQLSPNAPFIMGAGAAAVVLLSWICALYLA
jgi:membrane associated rhomboid family serine protease